MQPRLRKTKIVCFLSFVMFLYDSLDMCVSFGKPIEMKVLAMSLGGIIKGRGDRTQWYEGIKRNNGTGKVK